jgi:1-acyl-sn-glycerol-3-phosphate acyltransferase
MAACGGGAAEPRITLADVDASLEPVAPLDIEDEEEGGDDAGAGVPAYAPGAEGLLQEEGPPADALAMLAAGATPSRARAELQRGAPPARAAPTFFDPWANDRAPMTWPHAAAAVLLVPPRVALCIALAAAALPVSIALLALAAALPPRRRAAPWVRTVTVAPIRFLCRLALLGGGFYWVRSEGVFDARANANIVVANHASVADVLYAVWAFAPAFLAKREALRIPYVGAAARALGCVFVERTDASSRAAARAAIAERAAAPPGAFPPLMIFPEGTCTAGLCLIAWERGAFAPGQPVLPVAVAYPKGQPKPDALFSLETLRTLARVRNRMHVAYLPPRRPSAAEARSPAAFAAAVQAEVALALDVPISAQTYREGLHRKRREGGRIPGAPAQAAAAAAELRRALPPLPFREQGAQRRSGSAAAR